MCRYNEQSKIVYNKVSHKMEVFTPNNKTISFTLFTIFFHNWQIYRYFYRFVYQIYFT